MSTVEEIVVRLRADGRSLDANLSASERRIARFSTTTQRTGRSMTRSLTLPILAATAASAKMALDFDHQFALIDSLVGASGKQLAMYRTEVLKMGPELGKAPAELAKALYFVTSSGFEGAAALRVLAASAKASAAGLGDTAVVADAVTSAVNAYGEKTLSATRATDILLAAVREGKAEPEAFAGSIGRVIPIAEKMGMTFGEVAGMMAAMSLNGTKADEAVTQISAALATAIKPTKEGADALKSVGESYASVRKSIADDGLLATIKKLDDAYDGNVEKLGAVFGNVRALRGILALTGASAEKYKGIIEEVGAAHGDTAVAFKKMSETDLFQLQQSWAELQKVAIEFGAVAVPMLLDVARAGTSVVEWFDDLDPAAQKTVLTIALFVAAVGPMLSIIGKAGAGLGVLVKAYRLLAPATAAAAVAQQALNVAQGTGKAGGLAAGAVLPNVLKGPGLKLASAAAPAAAGAGGAAAGGATAGGAAASTVAVGAGGAVLLGLGALAVIAGEVAYMAWREHKFDAQVKKVVEQTGVDVTKGAPASNYVGKGYTGARTKQIEGGLARGEAAGEMIQQLTLELSTTDSMAKVKALSREIEALKAFTKLDIDLSDLTTKTPGELDSLVQHVKRTTGLTEKTVKAMLDRVAGEKLKFTVEPPKMSDSEKALQNFQVLARGKGNLTAKQWKTAIMAMGPAGGEAGAAAAAAMLAKLNTLPAKAAAIAGRIAANLARGVSSATSTAQLQLEKLYIKNLPEAEGGSFVLNRATSFLAGEAGREVAAFFPLNDPRRSAEVFGDLTTQLAGVLPRGSGVKASGSPAAAKGGDGGSVGDTYLFTDCLFAQDFDEVIHAANKRGEAKVVARVVRASGSPW